MAKGAQIQKLLLWGGSMIMAGAVFIPVAYGAGANAAGDATSVQNNRNRVLDEYTATYYAITFDDKGTQSYNDGDFAAATYFYKEAQRRYRTLGIQFPNNSIAEYGQNLTAHYYRNSLLLQNSQDVNTFLLKEGELSKTDGEGYTKLYDGVEKSRKKMKKKDAVAYKALTLYQNRLVYIIILDASIDLKGGENISTKRWKRLETLYNTLDADSRYYSQASLILGWMRQVEASSILKGSP